MEPPGPAKLLPGMSIAALLTAGIVPPEQLDELVTDAIERFLRGSRVAIR
jgi:hypothetical protein